jgi:hypothetical protein
MTKSQITASVVEDSITQQGVRLTTLSLRYPRFIHSEFMTHRVFSRNASSSRAIPVAKMIKMVREDPAMPIHWGKNQKGMQADIELDWVEQISAKWRWKRASLAAADIAEEMMNSGLHKQVVNRILEPYQWISVVVTSTEWDNFFALRDHKDAEPNIQALARKAKAVMAGSTPNLLLPGDWHTPYVDKVYSGLNGEIREYATLDDRTGDFIKIDIDTALACSAARCARVSYLTHEGTNPSVKADLALYESLVGADPKHASPVEHQATPMDSATEWSNNFRGWIQHRWVIDYQGQQDSLLTK